MDDDRGPFRIGELADAAGVSAKTLRFYDEAGVLAPSSRTSAGYRLYDRASVDRVAVVRAAQTAGMTLDEIAVLLAALDSGNDASREVIDDAVVSVDDAIELLERLRVDLVRCRTD